VCLDLEDAVAVDRKARAREAAIPFLREDALVERAVRINSLRTAEGMRDIVAIVEARPAGGVVLLPKVATPDEVRWAEGLIEEAGLGLSMAVLIESTMGLENAASILSSSRRIAFAMFGGADLAAELGAETSDRALLYARSRTVHAARLAGVDLFDVPSLDFRNLEAVRAEALRARELGFTGKGAIHPTNIATINAAFSPSAAEVDAATRIVAAYKASPTGLAVVDGKLVERPVIRSMERILALASRTGPEEARKVQ
jgi:citrate lyase subunit beta/citryl-CoA lyase/(S)-citramalyl-CoA lyase